MESVKQSSYYAHGKLLLTAEYAVLDGAKALCLPTVKGQRMLVENHSGEFLQWNAFLPQNKTWFKASFNSDFELIHFTDEELGLSLAKIFKALKNLNSNFILKPLKITTFLEFNKDWGLGSSSTLISLLAQWAKVNPYELLEKTFGGSGYDIACATASKPLLYRNKSAVEVDFKPQFSDSLYFIYLNRKKNSREAIKQYKSKPKNDFFIKEISSLTDKITNAKTLAEFELFINQHENLISNHIEIPRVQDKLFSDYNAGVIKSLGGWGGDFILATGNQKSLAYFKNKGYSTIFTYSELIL